MLKALAVTILGGGFLLAAAFLAGGRYQIANVHYQTIRLDKWTGQVTSCSIFGEGCKELIP